jgi:hypothetical protein
VHGIDPAVLVGVLARLMLACLVLASASADASRGIAVHASYGGSLVRDPALLRTLRTEMTRALDGARVPGGYKLDVSLVRLDAARSGVELHVHAEVRALLSDNTGRIRWTSTARSIARGSQRDRALLERDAVAATAHQLGTLVRTHARRGR